MSPLNSEIGKGQIPPSSARVLSRPSKDWMLLSSSFAPSTEAWHAGERADALAQPGRGGGEDVFFPRSCSEAGSEGHGAPGLLMSSPPHTPDLPLPPHTHLGRGFLPSASARPLTAGGLSLSLGWKDAALYLKAPAFPSELIHSYPKRIFFLSFFF